MKQVGYRYCGHLDTPIYTEVFGFKIRSPAEVFLPLARGFMFTIWSDKNNLVVLSE